MVGCGECCSVGEVVILNSGWVGEVLDWEWNLFFKGTLFICSVYDSYFMLMMVGRT